MFPYTNVPVPYDVPVAYDVPVHYDVPVPFEFPYHMMWMFLHKVP